jgi:hypothetical protein
VRDLVDHFGLDGAIADGSPEGAHGSCSLPQQHSHKCG